MKKKRYEESQKKKKIYHRIEIRIGKIKRCEEEYEEY